VRAGAVSAAALLARNTRPDVYPAARHCEEDEYRRFLEGIPIDPAYRRHKLGHRRRFVRTWPELQEWFAVPLPERVGRLPGEDRHTPSFRISYQARGYLLFLALRGFAVLDLEWLLGIDHLRLFDAVHHLGIDLGVARLVEEAKGLGFNPDSASQAMRWSVSRIVLHTGTLDVDDIGSEDIDEMLDAVRRFGERADIARFFGSAEHYRTSRAKSWTTHLHQLQVVLFHRGQIAEQPRKLMPRYAVRPTPPPRMAAVIDRYLAARRLTERPATVSIAELSLSRFVGWLAETSPELTSFAEVTRDHALGFLAAMAENPIPRTGQPLSQLSRRGRTCALSTFFRDTAAWEWEDVPGRPLLGATDLPKLPARIPRYIPTPELERLMVAVREVDCPYQRAALLVARWSGARQGEIRRLAVDCLDRYQDGTARLRLPAGKTFTERTVPMHEEAAQALRAVIEIRGERVERPFTDELTGTPTRYLFMDHGKLLSTFYLFETPLQRACKTAGLVDARGRGTVSSHRFRHTVGTQLAEGGARLRTIMNVLGHVSPSMAMVYAQISDPEVLRDYQAVLAPGARIAGPFAEALRSGPLSDDALNWLRTNFFKTELELGRCLRLPQEGPCECDLYLTCAKFVTTPAYAPRLRQRRAVELELLADAAGRGWEREVERHGRTITRLEALLQELGEPFAGPGDGAQPGRATGTQETPESLDLSM
jgi:integrase